MIDRLMDWTGSQDRTEAMMCVALSALPLGAVAVLYILKLTLT